VEKNIPNIWVDIEEENVIRNTILETSQLQKVASSPASPTYGPTSPASPPPKQSTPDKFNVSFSSDATIDFSASEKRTG